MIEEQIRRFLFPTWLECDLGFEGEKEEIFAYEERERERDEHNFLSFLFFFNFELMFVVIANAGGDNSCVVGWLDHLRFFFFYFVN